MHFTVVVQVKRCGLLPTDLTAKTFMPSIPDLTNKTVKDTVNKTSYMKTALKLPRLNFRKL